ncbi:cation:proton antiporter [Acholeplasma hippikon]|uniref:cation:proton antiporter n=1 Tax=Acholeplasma hippikon TaxID=264636 RepID=UPI0018D4ED5C|nr:cation:proton antiporter [Acholeplasma hippikon]
MITGLLFGKLAKAFKLPNVTGYIVGGILVVPVIGLFGIHIIPEEGIEELKIISQIALGFIAFAIGTEFKLDYFKKVGTQPIIIAIFESLLAILVVFGLLTLFGELGIIKDFDFSFALVLSAIAAATAPAATIMVIKQYKAKGDVTENLLSVVAIDDATAIIFFGIFAAIAQAIGNTGGETSLGLSIAKPFLEILSSLGVGFVAGLILHYGIKWFTGRGNRISLVLAMIFLVASMSMVFKQLFGEFEFSPLLACMMMGAVFTNMAKEDAFDIVMYLVDRINPPIFILFFVLSGMELNLSVLTTVGLIGIIYIVGRVIGKVLGARLGAEISKAPENVKKYIGWGLVPQAGVAIGLTIVAESIVPHYAPQIKAVILAATFIYELFGPLITKTSLKAAGEIAADK